MAEQVVGIEAGQEVPQNYFTKNFGQEWKLGLRLDSSSYGCCGESTFWEVVSWQHIWILRGSNVLDSTDNLLPILS